MTVGATLVRRAEALGWSQEEIAKMLRRRGKRAKLTRETVGRWKRGIHDMKSDVYEDLRLAVEAEERRKKR